MPSRASDSSSLAVEDRATSAALYRLLTWLSPAYPVGAYSYSHGVEAAVEEGTVRNLDDLVQWLVTVVRHGSGRSDGVQLVHAYESARHGDSERLLQAAILAGACRPTAELALESSAQGRAFIVAATSDWCDGRMSAVMAAFDAHEVTPCHSIAVGIVAALRDVPLESAVCAYLQSFVGNLVSAAVRLVPLGQSDGVRALERLEPTVLDTAQEVLFANLDDIGTATPAVDLASARHETQYSRLFRS